MSPLTPLSVLSLAASIDARILASADTLLADFVAALKGASGFVLDSFRELRDFGPTTFELFVGLGRAVPLDLPPNSSSSSSELETCISSSPLLRSLEKASSAVSFVRFRKGALTLSSSSSSLMSLLGPSLVACCEFPLLLPLCSSFRTGRARLAGLLASALGVDELASSFTSSASEGVARKFCFVSSSSSIESAFRLLRPD